MLKPVRGLKVLQKHYLACNQLGNATISWLHVTSSPAHDNAAAYYHCCTILSREFSAKKDSSSSSFMSARFLHAPKHEGESHTNIKRPWAVSVEKTKVVPDKVEEFKTFAGINSRSVQEEQPRKRVRFEERTNILVDILLKLKDSKEGVYGALDSWVAKEETFPSNVLKRALYMLEKKQQWHRTIQVIKWMLSKGQCMTMNTYKQLLCALDKDGRVEEAHAFWEMRIGSDLHSVPWQLCTFMMCMYERNNMPERLIKLFNDLEMYNRKPPDKAIIKTVADTYELLGLHKEQERVLEEYCGLFKESSNNGSKKKKGRKAQDSNDDNSGKGKLAIEGYLSGDSELL